HTRSTRDWSSDVSLPIFNAGSSISIYGCPWLLDHYGRMVAFGVPATMMFIATIVFYAGRNKYTHVPPAGKKWLQDVLSPEGLKRSEERRVGKEWRWRRWK